MSEWLPISSAPRDGTRILLVKQGFVVCIGWFSQEFQKWLNFDGEDFNDDGEFFEDMARNSVYFPTHWQPLPKPPTGEGGK